MRLSRLLLVLFSAQLASGCGEDHNPVAPTAGVTPPAPTATPAATGELIRGIVIDTGARVVPGARVEVLDGPSAGAAATSDGQGEFALTGTFDESTEFRATREGHAPAVGRLVRSCPTCPRWLAITLDVLAAPISVEGAYTLTVAADPTCTALPDAARRRAYEVQIRPTVARPTTSFEVVVEGGADVVAGYRTGWLAVAGDYVQIGMGDWHGTPGIVERLAGATYVAFDGGASGSIAAARLSTFDAPFEGVVDYCDLPEPMVGRYSCSPPAGFIHVVCTSRNHRLTLERR